MQSQNAIRWKVVLLINVAMLGGCLIAVFIVPPATRFSVFASICVAILIGFNVLLYFKGYRQAELAPSADAPEARRKRQKRIVIFSLIWALLLFEIARRFWWK